MKIIFETRDEWKMFDNNTCPCDLGIEKYGCNGDCEDCYKESGVEIVKKFLETENLICNRAEDRDLLIPYIGKPVYINGYRWAKSFDGWVVIYEGEESQLCGRNLVFDYKGNRYSVFGFLPSRYTSSLDSSYHNAFYKGEKL